MIKFLKYSEINIEKYHNCLENSYQNSDFAEKKFLDIVSDLNWFLLVYGDYDAIMPVTYSRKFRFVFVLMPKLCQQLGIFSKKDDPKINSLFYNFLHQNFLVGFYAFNAQNKFENLTHKKTSYILGKNNYSEIKKKYSKNRRRNVRITSDLEGNLVFDKDRSENVEIFFKQNVKGVKNQKEVLLFYDIFNKLLDQNIGKVRLLEFKNNIQSFIYLYEGKRTEYLSLFVNIDPLANANFPSLIIDYCLQEFISNKNFDFVGSDLENIAEFNQRFGAEPYQYAFISNSKFTLFKKLLTGYRIISNFAP